MTLFTKLCKLFTREVKLSKSVWPLTDDKVSDSTLQWVRRNY